MERTTQNDVDSAFRNWLAMVHGESNNNVGGFRLGHDGYGKTRIEQVISLNGAIHVVALGMTVREFVNAVNFMERSLSIKEYPDQYILSQL